MDILVFDVKSSLAHFRRPDTTSTHASYPFIPRTTLRGLLAAILGREDWPEEGWTGLQIRAPVQTRVQQLSMLGKGFLEAQSAMLNRPTTVELVVNPAYRVYYTGALLDELDEWITQKRAVFPTYLGSAYALTVPLKVGRYQADSADLTSRRSFRFASVVPAHIVENLEATAGKSYARVGGVLYRSLPQRRFRGTINFVYERNLHPFTVTVKAGPFDPSVLVVPAADTSGYVALW